MFKVCLAINDFNMQLFEFITYRNFSWASVEGFDAHVYSTGYDKEVQVDDELVICTASYKRCL